VLVLDRRTLYAYVRNVRALGHLLNQSTHALNAIAKAVRESGVDALDLTEAMEGVAYGLGEVRQDVVEVRRQGAELTGRPVVFGE
jgi:glycerate-2-kinase